MNAWSFAPPPPPAGAAMLGGWVGPALQAPADALAVPVAAAAGPPLSVAAGTPLSAYRAAAGAGAALASIAKGAAPAAAPAPLSARACISALLLAAAAFAYLWFAAGGSAGTWFWPAWYAAALLQGSAAAALVASAFPAPRRTWSLPVALLLLCAAAPVLHVGLLELILREPDRGDGRHAWALTAGRVAAATAAACAVLAALLLHFVGPLRRLRGRAEG